MRRIFLSLLMGWMLFTGWSAAAQDHVTTGCGTPIDAGQSAHSFDFDGRERRYLLYIPANYDPSQPAPLVLSLHGFSSNPTQQVDYSQWNPVADEHGFIVVYPQGTGVPLRWNSGLNIAGEAVDDVAFINALIDRLSESLCIDANRIYSTGLSNGGGMSNRLACELSDRIAAIGGVAGAYTLPTDCNPSRPVPVIAFHGTEDRIVPYNVDGEGSLNLPKITQWAADWAARNQCDSEPETLPAVGDVSGIEYTHCADDASVILYTIEGGGHTWPGGEGQIIFVVGRTNHDINASELMWDFFEEHPLPADD
ncbi:MAG: poly(3-hydroxybutyrate) depolymerase [Anaerolineae bacterium]|nr:poly(3-hydroxybutyrate) depolymerase [Anaerolineae bacterium]